MGEKMKKKLRMTKKKAASSGHYSRISWHSMNYSLLNGFLLPDLAYSALCDLIRTGRFHNLDESIQAGIRLIIEENAPLLMRTDAKWIRLLSQMNETFKNASHAKADEAGTENVHFLKELYNAMGHD
jgi:Arc/MetJ-type ribon-helix-helix transcriptional regulator